MLRLLTRNIQIPIKTSEGIFLIEMSPKGLYAVRFPAGNSLHSVPSFKTVEVVERFRRYFSDPLVPLISIKLDLSGYTEFEKKVYGVLRRVPSGEVITYGALAKRAGAPGAARAVGTAMRKNRIPIVIPCHRVVPSSGGLGEYSAGKKWKQWLLEHERSFVAPRAI